MERRPKTANNAAIQQLFYCSAAETLRNLTFRSRGRLKKLRLQINVAPVNPKDIAYQNFLWG